MQNLFQISVMMAACNFLSAVAFGQNQWTRQSPLPAARNLTGVAWATTTHGFASGERETFIETFDGGATWQNANLGISPTTDPFYNTYCRDAANCFLLGNSSIDHPDHWRTTDSGATWQQITSFPNGGSWRYIDFVSASVGFMGSNGATARTTDGGATWTLMSGSPACPVMYGMDFRDAQVGLVGGNRVSTTDGGPGIFKTIDAGVTWVRKFPQSANDVLWLSDTTAIAPVGVSIYRSTDAGETWSAISSQISTGLGEMELLPNGTIVGVSDGGDAWRSTDGGFKWTRTLVGLGALPAVWNLSFLDNQIGAIVGQSGFIYKTTDGGLTWAMLNNGIGGVHFHDLEMFDDSAGLAVGDNGYFLRTANGGSRWETGRLQVTGVVAGRNENLQAVSVVDQDFAVAAGFEGVVYKTFDRGVTWQSIGYPNLDGGFYISDVKFNNRNFGYVTGSIPGSAQNMFLTNNGGASWEPASVNGGSAIDFIDANHGWVVSLGGLGQRTTDGGATWQQMILPNQGFTPSILRIDFINENEGWAVGWFGYAAHTSDGGRSWQLQNVATTQDVILGLHVLSETEAFAVGSSSPGGVGSFYHTNDAGATWTTSPLPSQGSLTSIFARPSRKVWAAGSDGTVLHNPSFTAPLPALLLTLSPTYILGGSPVQGTIHLGNPAPAGGAMVTLTSGNSSLVGVPSSVVIPAGATSATFTVTTQPVNQEPSRVGITATYSGQTSQAYLVLAPASVCSFSISPSDEYFGSSGGTILVHVSAPAGCAWTAVTDHTWMSFPNGDNGVGNGEVTLEVFPEEVGLARFGTALIAGSDFGVIQAPLGGCTYALASSGQTFGFSGGSGQVAVSASSCSNPWIVHNSASWITVHPLSGQGDGLVNFEVAPNNTGATRAGTFTVSGRGFTITQTAGAPTPTPIPTATSTPISTATPTPTPVGTPTPTPTAVPSPTPSPSPTHAINLSTRMRVQTGDNVGIGGFIIMGSTPKHVLLRAIGPSLTGSGVPDALADPVLELHGPGGFATVTNNDWRDTQEAEIQATGIPPTNDFESAIAATLAPGAYTAIVRGNGNTSGVALVEVYDLSQEVSSKLANLSTRAFVSTGENIVIAGFMLGGNSSNDRIVVRGLGPSLSAAGLPNVLANPALELRDNNGALLIANDNWQDNPAQAAETIAAGLVPTNPLESALAATLPPGPYTALLAGLNNASGIGVVEVYDLGATP